MKPDTDSIVAEILKENPELALTEASLRALVVELQATQPVVAVDPAFKARLRAALLSETYQPKARAVQLPWWLLYTVPVGITALLLLVVQPESVTAPLEPTTTNTETFESAPTMMKMEDEGVMRMMDTGLAEDVPFAEPAPLDGTDFFTAAFTPDYQYVRVSFAEVTRAAFIAVIGKEGRVATSGLLLPGEHVDVLIPVTAAIPPGTSYGAYLYYDNGDGAFVMGDEMGAIDNYGAPIAVTLKAE